MKAEGLECPSPLQPPPVLSFVFFLLGSVGSRRKESITMTIGRRMALREVVGRGRNFGHIYKKTPSSSCHDPFGTHLAG